MQLILMNLTFIFQNNKLSFFISLFALLTCNTNPLFSQSVTDSIPSKQNTSLYIFKYDTLLSIGFSVNSEFDFFEIDGDDFYYDIRPNISFTNKLSISYRFLTLKLGFKPKFFPGNNSNDMQGKTKMFRVDLNYYSKHWFQDLHYVFVKGFYLHNTGDFDSDWVSGTDPYIQFPELKVEMFRGSTGYKFNPDFSLKAIGSQTEKQIKSAGSLITFLTYDYFTIDNKTGDPTQYSSQKSNNFALTASPGYIYTFVIKSDFHATIGVFPGIGFQYTKLTTRFPDQNYVTNYIDPLYRLTEKAGIGYSSDKFFTGAEVSFSQSFHQMNKSKVNEVAIRTYFQVFAGYRFNAPKFLKRETKKLGKLLHMQ